MGLLGESSPMVIVGIIIAGVSFLLHLIGFSTPYWYKVGNSHIGLWKGCDASGCSDLTNLTSSYKGAQALECLAFIAFFAALVCIVLKLFVMKDQKLLYIVLALSNFIAGGFGIIGVIVYGTMDNYSSSKFHFSFAFCIIASLGGILAGILVLLGRDK